ncbi:MAG: hypothetical protein M3M91_02225 [Thermoproteota archaeon]|nr:hypothetical protein [Thermoproteota archaeon]
MKTTLKAAVTVLTAFAIIGGIFGISAPVMAQIQNGGNTATTPDMSMGMGGGGDMMSMMHEMMANHKWGMISSIQNDEQGQPAWIVAGHWMMEMGSQNSTQNDTATSDTTGRISNIAGFDATLHMVMLNGSAMHDHEISSFTQTGDTTFDSGTNSTTITGTATVTMREGPVPNVPITIEIAQDKVIAITPDPATLENHFGNTPIYGLLVSPEMIQDMMMGYGDRMDMTNMTGMTGMMQ